MCGALIPLLLLTGTCSPPQHEIPVWASDQSFEPVRWPAALRGQVALSNSEPAAGARVSVDLVVQLYVFGGLCEHTVHSAETRTDESGKWSVPTENFPPLRHRPFSVQITATAEGLVPWQTWAYCGVADSQIPAGMPNIRLDPGHVVSGRCVDEQGRAASGARFRLYTRSPKRGRWGLRHYACSERGEFRFLVPREGTFGYWITGETLAPRFELAPDREAQDVTYKLRSGARLIGFVRGPGGLPVGGAVVKAVSVKDGRLPSYTLPFRVAAQTDAQGRFRLPPLSGEYNLVVTSAGEALDGRSLLATSRPPLFVPQLRELRSGREPVILRAAPRATIAGNIVWPDGAPAGRSEVRAYRMPEGNGPGLLLVRSVTDKQGAFKIELPRPLRNVLLQVPSRRFDGQSVHAVLMSASGGFESEDGFARTDVLAGDATVAFRFQRPTDN